MKAVFIEHYGDSEVLEYGDLPDPVAAPGEVVIDVVAASVNAADWKARAGQYAQSKFPLVLGRDFSGVVSTVGSGVEDLKKVIPSLGSARRAKKGATLRRSRSRLRSSPRSRTGYRTLTPLPWLLWPYSVECYRGNVEAAGR